MQLDDALIGRKKELKKIDGFIRSFGEKRILFISGPGGIGKTRLLQEVKKKYRGVSGVYVTDILDFDETSLRITENLTREIASQLGTSFFEQYFLKLDDLAKMQTSGVSLNSLEDQAKKTVDTFIECFNSYTKNCRAIILLDTTELIRGSETWKQFSNLSAKLENSVLIFAGRNTDNEYHELLKLRPQFNSRILHLLTVKEFSGVEADEFFSQKNLNLDPSLSKKIQYFTHGHPILLSLANEWLRRKMSLPELLSMTIKEIRELDENSLRAIQNKFEKELVNSIMNLPDPLGQVMLLMAFIDRRFDIEILQVLSNYSFEKATQVIQQLNGFAFIKGKSKGIALHDELKRLILTYLWARYDPTGSEGRELCKKITGYYDRLISSLEDDIQNRKRDVPPPQQVVVNMEARGALENRNRELQVLHIDRLHYAWRSGINEGYKRFKESFDIRNRRFLKNYYRALLDESISFEAHLLGKQSYDYLIEKTRFLRWDNRLDEAIKILKDLEKKDVNTPIEQANIFSALAGYYIEDGNLPDALAYSKMALSICEKSAPDNLPVIEKLVGMITRRMGRWKEAEAYYENVLTQIEPKGTKNLLELASALNNLSFLNGLQGDWTSGLFSCQRALRIRERYGTDIEIASSLITLGSVYWAKEDFTNALDCYDQAYSRLHWPDHSEIIARVHFSRGIAYWFAEDYEAARVNLEKCIYICKSYDHFSDLPLATHNLGHIYWELKDFKHTEELFKEGYELSTRFFDYQAKVDSLAGFAELYYQLGRLDEVYPYAKELKRLEKEGYHFPLFAGRVERIIGDIEYDAKRYDNAVKHYCDGLIEIARHGGYGKYSLHQELLRLGKKMESLPTSIVSEWCNRLSARWAEEGLVAQRPELVKFCLIWRSTSFDENTP